MGKVGREEYSDKEVEVERKEVTLRSIFQHEHVQAAFVCLFNGSGSCQPELAWPSRFS